MDLVTVDYMVITAPTPAELVKAVQKQLHKDNNEWEPLGGPVSHNGELVQAMILSEEA